MHYIRDSDIRIIDHIHNFTPILHCIRRIVINMASNTLTPASSSVNLLAYLRSKTSIDVDCLDLNGETKKTKHLILQC